MDTYVHPTALISDGAEIGAGTKIGPYSIIGPKVRIGKTNTVASHVVIEGNTTFGDGNTIFQFASIGSVPQDLKYNGEDSRIEIGNNNIIREYVTIQPGTKGGGMLTRLGDSNLFMANSHVGHDCIIGNRNIVANSVGLSGHVTLEDGVIIGGLSGIHQFVRLGAYSFLGGGTMATQDIPPYCMAQGDRAKLSGLNKVGLERNGFSEDEILTLRKIYRAIFMKSGILKDKLASIEQEYSQVKGVKDFLAFIKSSERGVCAHRSKKSDRTDDS